MNRLKELRQSQKITQSELAKQLKVTQGALSGWENERYSIGNDDLIKLADFFNVSTDYLLGRENIAELNSFVDIPKEKYTKEEKEVVAFWRKMNAGQRAALKVLIKSMNLK